MTPKILTIDGVNDEFILAYYCPKAVILTSGYNSEAPRDFWYDWYDRKNRFPLEDCDEENEYYTMYDPQTIAVYISRRGNILTFENSSCGGSEPFLYDEPLEDITDGIGWMHDDYNDVLNDPENIYIIDMTVDGGGHTNFILIDDQKFINKVGKMDKSEIYHEVEKYISNVAQTQSYEQASRFDAYNLIIKDGIGYDDCDRCKKNS